MLGARSPDLSCNQASCQKKGGRIRTRFEHGIKYGETKENHALNRDEINKDGYNIRLAGIAKENKGRANQLLDYK